MLAVVTVVDDGRDARRAPKESVWFCLANFKGHRDTKKNTVDIDVLRISEVFMVFFGQHLETTVVFTQF